MSNSYEYRNHLEWLGYVQPVGLLVSTPAMLDAQCQLNQNMGSIHREFLAFLPGDDSGDPLPEIRDFADFLKEVLGWEDTDLVEFPADSVPENLASLEVVLETYNETLRPTYAVPDGSAKEGESPWCALIKELPLGTDLDSVPESIDRSWHASPQSKFERLLRETGNPFGILANGSQVRLVYAPKGETSGYITFEVDQMLTVAGRPIYAALHMLLEADRMFGVAKAQRLPAILAASRKYQNTVSNELSEQVMSALFELLRGFQSANDHRGGELLKEILAHNPQHIYNGLLNVLMRLVFILYAEDRGLVSTGEVYSNHYSLTGLFNRLRSDHGRYPDTMDQRYGSWSQLLTLFRLIFDGGRHGEMEIYPRKGYLFDYHRFPFLEGRYDDGDVGNESEEELSSQIQVPHVSDKVVYEVLKSLLILKGERLSYRALDVEQIGSVYEAIMGFELEVSEGRSIAIKPVKRHGAPSTINLEALLATPGKDRGKKLKDWSDQKLTGAALKELKEADTVEGLSTALSKKIAKSVTPNIVPKGAMVFQPSDERRRSGSHYTPRSLTEPIVKTTLEPILKQLTCVPGSVETSSATPTEKPATSGLMAAEEPAIYKLSESATVAPQPISKELRKRLTPGQVEAREKLEQKRAEAHTAAIRVGSPHPSQILDLKICDPAMGSGAFLVEACRQLGDELIKAWYAHDAVPTDIPPDEDEVLYARRLIAQRCLYGVDKNVMAVDLAKLSLWLVTLAKDHAFTFLDHALRHGDSLVGLTREQIIGFHWEVKKQKKFGEDLIQRRLDRATEARAKILNAREDVPYRDQQQRMASADEALDLIRLVGDACVSGFFAGQKKKEREEHAERLFGVASSYLESLTAGRGKQVDFESRRVLGQAAARLRAGSHPIPAFHWEIEFPEVFARENGGFDAFVGNPPFQGVKMLGETSRQGYTDWLRESHEETGGKSDLVAFFFREVYERLRQRGAIGLIATKTIAQGDTRRSSLSYLARNGATIYAAIKHRRWPGQASVMVSVIHLFKGGLAGPFKLDDKAVSQISSYLLVSDYNDDPKQLTASEDFGFLGTKMLGMGFLIDDDNTACPDDSLIEDALSKRPTSSRLIRPYMGGEELNSLPKISYRRKVIDFGNMTEEEARQYPELFSIIEQYVKPKRMKCKGHEKKLWWQYARRAAKLYDAISDQDKCIVLAQYSQTYAFAFLDTDGVINSKIVAFASDRYAEFAWLQSHVHECWARFLSGTLGNTLQYTPSACLVTFPFPRLDGIHQEQLEAVGESFYQRRADTMLERDIGLTDMYHLINDRFETSTEIEELRRLHGLMDGAVLRAYGWDDLAESARCEFLLDYEEEEDDAVAGPGAPRKPSKKKKPWRLRWPDEFRDEVLARLLELNEQRHQEEFEAGIVDAKGKRIKSKPRSKGSAEPDSPRLF